MRNMSLFKCFLLLCFTILTSCSTQPSKVKIILDTDMLTDCDDTGAIAMLHALADRGEVEIMGILLNGKDDHKKHGAVVSAINYYYGRSGIPIGETKRYDSIVQNKASSYSRQIWQDFKHDGLLDGKRPDAVSVYRSLLSAAEDHSVTIVSIGFLTNIEDLLKSSGDSIDKRTGVELVKAKVKEFSVMGGMYPAGSEYNFNFDNPGEKVSDQSTKYVLENWPDDYAPITFLGYEIGKKLITGKAYNNTQRSPMKTSYKLAYNSLVKGRPSWDQGSVLYAVRGLSYNGEQYWTVENKGYNKINNDGSNEWQSKPDKNHSYLKEAMNPEKLSTVIEELMIQQPQLKLTCP